MLPSSPRQSRPFCARCRLVCDADDTEGVWAFIQEHGVVGFVSAGDPMPVVIPSQRAPEPYEPYIEVALEQM